MANEYSHDDGTPLVCEQGAAGISPSISKQEVEQLYTAGDGQPLYSLEHTSCFGSQSSYNLPEQKSQSMPPPIEEMAEKLCNEFPETAACDRQLVARVHNGGTTSNTINRPLTFGVIIWGRVHEYPADQWNKVAQEWRRSLLREAEFGLRSFDMDVDNLRDYDKLCHGSIGAYLVSGTSQAIAQFKSWFADRNQKLPPLPTEDDFGALRERMLNACTRALNNDPIEYKTMYAVAIEYIRIRGAQKDLNHRFTLHREGVIEGAGTAIKGLEITESTAFTVLDMAARAKAKIEFPGNPLGEAGYRLCVAMLHAATKGAAESLAGNSARKAVQELGAQLGKDVPDIFADALVKLLTKKMTFLQEDSPLDRAATGLMKVLVQTLFETIDFYVFVLSQTPEAQKEQKVEEFKKEKLFAMLRDAIAVVIGALFNVGKDSPKVKVFAERLVTESFKTLSDDMRKAQAAAKAEKKTPTEEFLQELPWTLVRIVTGVATGLADKKLESMAEADHKAAASRPASPAPAKKEYKPALGIKRKDASPKVPLLPADVKPVKPVAVVDRAPVPTVTDSPPPPNPAVAQIIAEVDAIDLTANTQGKTAIFYSGMRGKNQQAAKAHYATDPSKYVIIDETAAGTFLDGKKLYADGSPVSKAEADQIWSHLSARYASSVSGPVIAFVEQAEVNRVWVKTEWQTLGNNPAVTNIITNETDRPIESRADFDSKRDFFTGPYRAEKPPKAP